MRKSFHQKVRFVLHLNSESQIKATLLSTNGELTLSGLRRYYPNLLTQFIQMRKHQNIHLSTKDIISLQFLKIFILHFSENYRFLLHYWRNSFTFSLPDEQIECGNVSVYSVNDKRPLWISREAVKFGFFTDNLDRTLEFSGIKNAEQYSGFINVAPPSFIQLLKKLSFEGIEEYEVERQSLMSGVVMPFLEPISNQRNHSLLSNAEVMHGQIVIHEGKVLLNKARIFENQTRWPAPFLILKTGFAQVLPCNNSSSIDEAIFVGTAQNWFHFMVEVMTKIQTSRSDNPIPVIVPANLANSQYEAIRMISGVHPLISSNFQSVKVGKLHFCSDGIPKSITDISYLVPELRKIRMYMLDLLVPRKESRQKKVFVKRQSGLGRPMHNLDEIEEILRGFGFVGVYPDELSFEDQVRVFSEADILVIERGAAMTNIMFCKDTSTILEINSGDGEVGFWREFSSYFNLRFFSIEGVKKLRGRQGYTLEVPKLLQALALISTDC